MPAIKYSVLNARSGLDRVLQCEKVLNGLLQATSLLGCHGSIHHRDIGTANLYGYGCSQEWSGVGGESLRLRFRPLSLDYGGLGTMTG